MLQSSINSSVNSNSSLKKWVGQKNYLKPKYQWKKSIISIKANIKSLISSKIKNIQAKHEENKQLKKKSNDIRNRLVAISTREKHNVNEEHNEDSQTGRSHPMYDSSLPLCERNDTVTNYSETQIKLHHSQPEVTTLDSQQEQPQSLFINPLGKLVAANKGIKWVTEASVKVAGKADIDNGPLGQCIQLLECEPFAQNDEEDSRSSCTKLFDSYVGQQLFTVVGNANYPDYHKALKIDANQVPVDIDSTLRFIELFTKAILQESKEGSQETLAQGNKKRERLQALGEISEFVTHLDPNAPDAAALCRLALQLCGRCRERSLVRQQSLRLCGAFATLQAAWGKVPLKMTRLALKLACDYEACSELDKVNFKLPEGTDFSRYDSALADSLLLSAFFNLNKVNGTNVPEIILLSRSLGIEVQQFDNKQKLGDFEFINSLEQATSYKAAVSLSLDKKLTSFLKEYCSKNFLENWSRKGGKQRWNIEKDFKSFNGSVGNDHRLIMDSCRMVDNGNLEIKIQSWGKVMRLEMETQTLLDHIRKHETLIFHTGIEGLNRTGVFNKPDNYMYHFNSNGKLELIDTRTGGREKFEDYEKGCWSKISDLAFKYENNQGDLVFFDFKKWRKTTYPGL